jgi:hypothetical protein
MTRPKSAQTERALAAIANLKYDMDSFPAHSFQNDYVPDGDTGSGGHSTGVLVCPDYGIQVSQSGAVLSGTSWALKNEWFPE